MDNNNKSEPATKSDVKAAVKAAETALRSEMQNVESRLSTEMATVKTELKTDIGKAGLQAGSKTGIDLLGRKINTLGIELAKTHLHMDRMEDNMMTALRGFKSEILSAIDTFAAEAQAYRNHDTLRGHAIMDHDAKLKDHENRLTALETK